MNPPDACLLSREAILSKILEARDRRDSIRKDLTNRFRLPLVQLTVVFPGPNKGGELPSRIHTLGRRAVSAVLRQNQVPVMWEQNVEESTGNWSLWVVEGKVELLKEKMIALEETHPAGRFFDIDIIDLEGTPLSRTSLGVSPRRCFLCEREASRCIREQRHHLEELVRFITYQMQNLPLEG